MCSKGCVGGGEEREIREILREEVGETLRGCVF